MALALAKMGALPSAALRNAHLLQVAPYEPVALINH
jgi:hypothetical protein